MSHFLEHAHSRDLRLHEDIQTKSCAACGSIFVPGINTKVRVVPVKETKLERERRKKATRRKEAKKLRQSDGNKDDLQAAQGQEAPSGTIASSDNSASGLAKTKPLLTNTTTSMTTEALSTRQPRNKKIIHITPYTELIQLQQQHQQHQQAQRRLGGPPDMSAIAARKKAAKRANQLLNHVVYSCQRCHRETELPGTKQAHLTSRVKEAKIARSAAASRRSKKAKKDQALALEDSGSSMLSSPSSSSSSALPTPSSASTSLSTPSRSVSVGPALGTTASGVIQESTLKRPGAAAPSPVAPATKRPKHATTLASSLPGSPAARYSAPNSTQSSPGPSSPQIAGQDGAKSSGGGSSNKKKKKGGLASLLANQKAKDPSSDPSGGAAGSSNDSVLANFLMGL
ncbi:hypothetical protein BGZ99_005338 [Dissophora globulifera]|uniref:Uncharacterized protein n=1 Tax=Dissophora globulifera TaxID=979702 RepID=A0A9P6RHW3_9FUNG|nr:hypothetical protein BGZ99_005338 [Dissophora globulifera]